MFIKGGGFHASSVSPDYVFSPSGPFVVEGFDFSNLGTAFSFIDVAGSGAQVVFKNCKLPASWAGALQEVTPKIQAGVAAHNCDSGDTNYRLWVETLYGTIRDETTIVRTAGASNGATGLAWKVTTNTKPLFHAPLVTDEIVRWNEVTGSAITVTIEIVHDSATALKDDEVWLEIMYLGTSGAPL